MLGVSGVVNESEASVDDGRDDGASNTSEAQLKSERKVVLTLRLDYLELTNIARHDTSYLAEAIEASGGLDLVVNYDAGSLVIAQPCVKLHFQQLV